MPTDVPLIDSHIQQACIESARLRLKLLKIPDLGDRPEDLVLGLSERLAGHCFCWSAEYRDILHNVCCKCGDRYAKKED